MTVLSTRGEEPAPIGERAVRMIAFVMVTLTLFVGTRSHGGGAYLRWLAAGLFLLTAALPRSLGRIAGTIILFGSALALFMGPYGEPVITAQGILSAIPIMFVAGVMIYPSAVDAVVALFATAE